MILGKHCSWREPCVVKRAAREYKSAGDLRSMLLSERHLEEQRRDFWAKRKIARAHNGVLYPASYCSSQDKRHSRRENERLCLVNARKNPCFASCADRHVLIRTTIYDAGRRCCPRY